MKKLLFTSAAILLAFMSMQAQPEAITKNDTKPAKEERKEAKKEKRDERITLRNQEDNEVSYQSKEAFYSTYGDVPGAVWTKGKHFDQVLFNMDGIATTAYFDFDAQLVGTTALKTLADLPLSAQNQINKEYKNYTVENVLFFDDNEATDTDMILYGNEFEDADNFFVELKKDNKIIVLQVTMDGRIGLFAS
jgi:hypothetical protein